MYENIYQILRKNAFTLAEIMIALVVIGVITSILLPVAFNNVPNENMMKFKKGNATLAKVINELVTSGEYYAPGDLGKKPNGEMIDGKHNKDVTYFCKTFGEMVTTKSINCSEDKSANNQALAFVQVGDTIASGEAFSNGNITKAKEQVDISCKEMASKVGKEIVTSDNIVFYQTTPSIPYGILWGDSTELLTGSTAGCGDTCYTTRLFFDGHTTVEGFDRIYKIFCMDVDGVDYGEEPFGYGIRADGKILTGKRADEWMEKSIQDKE